MSEFHLAWLCHGMKKYKVLTANDSDKICFPHH